MSNIGDKAQRPIKFRAWDKINRRWLRTWKLYLAITGEMMAVEDIDGEVYGLHQVEITMSNTELEQAVIKAEKARELLEITLGIWEAKHDKARQADNPHG